MTGRVAGPPGEGAPDGRFHELRRVLSGSAPEPAPVPASREHAAVALVLRNQPDLELLLIKRSVSARDPWSGHMALPGGRWDRSDPHLRATAMRETREETGIVLADEQHLGHLSVVRPMGPRLPRITISPFVFGVEGSVEEVIDPREVEAAYWVRLEDLTDRSQHRTVDIPLRDHIRPFPAFLMDDEVVWGLTYRILSEFLTVLPDGL